MIETAQAFGVDIGGSGIKAAPVNLEKGEFAEPRLKILTPEVSTPKAVGEIIRQQLEHFEVPESAPVGIAFPAPIHVGEKLGYMANLDQSWVGVDVTEVFSEACGRPVTVVNDADAAGLAEVRFGAGKGNLGVVLIITIGTGLGTALFYGSHLQPNTEMGHVYLDNGVEAESYASEAVRVTQGLSWDVWGKRLNHYLTTMENLIWPDLIVLGGAVSKDLKEYAPLLHTHAPVVAASFLNQAGIVGAALFAEEALKKSTEVLPP